MINPKYNLRSAILVSRRPFDDLRWIPSSADPDNVSYTLISDTYLLLNSERIINALGEDSYRHLVNSIVPRKSPYEKNDKLTDEALFLVKSRHTQEHSELRAWSHYIMDKMETLITTEQEKQKLEQEKQELEQEKQNPKPTPNVEPKSE